MTQGFDIIPIGHIVTPYTRIDECPRNIDPEGPPCSLVVDKDKRQGLMGLSTGQRIMILYWLEKVDRCVLQQHSRRTGELAGIFALRTPNRCNPIGVAVSPIDSIAEGVITVRGLDCLNGTPLIDIKPAMTSE